MNCAQLYINGGGSLIQDVTSRRSLWYYLYNIRTAKKLGCRVQMYGCGIGPVQRPGMRKLSARILNRYVDTITLREPDSRSELEAMGVSVPRILLTADPALILPPASDDVVDSAMLAAGIPIDGKYICFTLRNWKGFEQKASLFARAAEYAHRTYGLTPLFLSVERHQDPGAAALAAQTMTVPHHFLQSDGNVGTLIGILARMQVVVSMRLHALVFAAGQGVPLAGVVYDPKVSSFLRYIGQDIFESLDALTEENLCSMIDRCMERAATPSAQAEAVERLKAMEQGNVTVALEEMGL
jgi:polysaccharide pyruvyl transferase CsaB